jgi:multiple sugar transport system permease protein
MQTLSNRSSLELKAAILFLLPNALGFLFFMLGPSIASIIISFMDWSLIGKAEFAGFSNFRSMVSDRTFWVTLRNTGVFVFFKVPLNIAAALVIAVLLNRKLPGKNFFRLVIFLPIVCSSVAVAMIWRPLLETSELGLLNWILGYIGLGPFAWLTSRAMAMPSVILISIWRELGYFMVIFIAGLQGISRTYYEAAEIDGAGPIRSFFNITVPLISPTTFFILITSIIGSFQIFDLTMVLTGGGPANATNTLVMYIYQAGFRFLRMGYASALAMALFIIILIFSFFQNFLAKRWVHTE